MTEIMYKRAHSITPEYRKEVLTPDMPPIEDLLESNVEEFEWEPLVYTRNHMEKDEVAASYLLHASEVTKCANPILRVYFGKTVYQHLNLKPGERVFLLQAPNNIYNYLLCKGAKGYKLQESLSGNKYYYFNFRLNRPGLHQFNKQLIRFEMYNNRTVRLTLPTAKGK